MTRRLMAIFGDDVALTKIIVINIGKIGASQRRAQLNRHLQSARMTAI